MSTNSLWIQRDLPNSFSVHLPPGEWNAGQQSHDFIYDGFHKYAAGKTTSLALGHAVWGPGGRLLDTWYYQLYFGSINTRARRSTRTTTDEGRTSTGTRGSPVRAGTRSPKPVIAACRPARCRPTPASACTSTRIPARTSRSGTTSPGYAVHNPASGHVSLRSTVTDTHGDSSTTTVYNAYAVG
ncbi:hypothetical protein ACFWAN_53475 [Streptomyces mirabilis]|uniref:hypothetical protein n=1 Tax=Streptomyces mirabilis TaxID=68239 RepID=UPI00365F0A66